MRLYEYIGNAVRAARAEAGLTQAELATAAGVTRSTIGNLETGRQQVPLEQLISVGRALRVDYREWLPDPSVLPRAEQGPVTVDTVRERAPATASLIDRLQQARSEHEPETKTGQA